MAHARRQSETCEINMTPMIDVVFQLIIFFVITVKMENEINESIVLEEATHGPRVAADSDLNFVIEVDQRGWISVHGAPLSRARLEKILKGRYRRYGQFPILIRGDYRTKHQDIRTVMDTCTSAGIWRISFAAIKEWKTK